MLLGKLVKYKIRLALALIIGLALIGVSPVPAQAQTSVDLKLGGEGATSWNIANIKPGDSGTKIVELHNAGSQRGSVSIWISDIEEADYAGDGAVLDDYVQLNLSVERLNSNITLPVTIHELPQSASDPYYIKIDTLYARETLTLVWEWEFPETGAPQNDAQGDSFSFTINYLLEELPFGGGGDKTPDYRKLEIDILGKVTVAKVNSSGELLYSCLATDPDNKHTLELDQGTKVTSADGKVIRRIEMSFCEEPPSPPSGMEMIGPAYELTGYTGDSAPCSIILDKPAELTLSYDPDWLPENTSTMLITWYEPGNGWTELEPASSEVAQANEITALISHTSVFAILAKIVPVSAEFELSELVINPARAEAGEPVTIAVTVQNTGQLEGSYTLTLEIDGEVEQSQAITLAAGESRQVSFTVIKDEPGTYTITLDSLTGEFTVLAPASLPPSTPASSPPWASTYWWAILLAALITALPVYFLTRRLRPHT
jgi:hypothetical protein